MAKKNSEHTEEQHGHDATSRVSASGLRLFCAVELPQEIRAQAARYIATLRESKPRGRVSWDSEEKLHLTLKFFGDVEEGRVTQLAGALERAASLINPFELGLRGTGAFPPAGLPRVLWLGVTDSSGRLDKLHQHIEDECARTGYARERKRFNPHLTIARLRSTEGARSLAALHKSLEFEAPAFPVTEIVLIRSELGAHGSRYTKLKNIGMKSRDEG
ncbi:MAG TPA: RNA 2',3'-cyclic phosphodiesterase [Pyrinomonadaceae bacterium]